jgi:hypothetical protein
VKLGMFAVSAEPDVMVIPVKLNVIVAFSWEHMTMGSA